MSLGMYDMAKIAVNRMEKCVADGNYDLAAYWAQHAASFCEDAALELRRNAPSRIETIEKVESYAEQLRAFQRSYEQQRDGVLA